MLPLSFARLQVNLNSPPMKKIILLAVFGLTLTTAYPWGNPGHMAVAAFAYDQLTPAERTKIVALIKKHPDLAPIYHNFQGAKPTDRELFMALATWPDMIRDDNHYSVDPKDPYELNLPAVGKVDYTKNAKHQGWHFQDTYFWCGPGPQTPLPKSPAVNAVGVIKVLVAQLHTKESRKEKAYDLGWLFHLVGDIHQPLHAVSAVTVNLPGGDHGGNWVHLSKVPGESELHALWDHLPGKATSPDQTTHQWHLEADVKTADTFVATLNDVLLGSEADNLDPAAWAAESLAIAKRDVYNFDSEVAGKPNPAGDPHVIVTLPVGYRETALIDAQARVKLAGHRLALILKQIAK